MGKTCNLPNGDVVSGMLQNAAASCQQRLITLGPSLIELYVHEPFSDWLELYINRIGMPMEITSPISEIFVDQHSNVTDI